VKRLGTRTIGTVTLAIAFVMLYFVFVAPTPPWAQDMHLGVEAGAYGQMNPGAWVEMGGVKVGQVDKIDQRNGHALIKVTIEHAYSSLVHSDASASIQPHGLLGPKYVAIQPGKTGKMKDNGIIPFSRVKVGTDFDQVINTFQPEVRDNLKVIFTELGTASENRGDDMNQALAALGRASDDLTTTTNVLRKRDTDIADFIVYSEQLNSDMQNAPISANIRDTDTVLSGLVPVEDSIGGSIDNTASVLRKVDRVMDGNSQNLAVTLQKLPGTVQRLRVVLRSGNNIVTALNPALPSLMDAVVETELAFRDKDDKGRYVNVYAITGACSTGTGPNKDCSSPDGAGDVYGRQGQQRQQSNFQPSGQGSLSDQQLSQLFLGG
jgi:virulence factor Mce-like protein